jgi:hypothetical protein
MGKSKMKTDRTGVLVLDGLTFARDDDAEGRWWCLIGGERYCYIIGGNGTYMAEKGDASFGPARTRFDAVMLVYEATA